MSRADAASLAAITLLVMVGGARAQTAANAEASLAIRDAFQISTLQYTTFGAGGVTAATPSTDALLDASTVIQISGDPSRAYSIYLPRGADREGSGVIEAIRARSENSGEFSNQQGGHTNTEGRDVVRLSGRVRMPANAISGAAAIKAMSFSINVE